MINLEYYLTLSIFLFCLGITLIIIKRNIVVVLMGIELILNAVNINLVAFAQYDQSLQGQFFALFVMVVATIETTIALAILVQVYKHYKTANLDEI